MDTSLKIFLFLYFILLGILYFFVFYQYNELQSKVSITTPPLTTNENISGKTGTFSESLTASDLKINGTLCIGNNCLTSSDISMLVTKLIYTSPVWGSGTFTIKRTDFSPLPSAGLYTLSVKRGGDGNLAWRWIGTVAVSHVGTFDSVNVSAKSDNMNISIIGGNLSLNLANGYPDTFIFTLKPLQLY